jgi:hypothetical protein
VVAGWFSDTEPSVLALGREEGSWCLPEKKLAGGGTEATMTTKLFSQSSVCSVAEEKGCQGQAVAVTTAAAAATMTVLVRGGLLL